MFEEILREPSQFFPDSVLFFFEIYIQIMILEKPTRNFIASDFVLEKWEDVQSYYLNLLERPILSAADFEKFLADRSELDAVLEENGAWRYIKMSIDTRDEALATDYKVMMTEIVPQIAPFEDKLNRKMMDAEFVKDFENQKEYAIFFRSTQTALELFHEKNSAIEAEISELTQQYGSIAAAQTITFERKEWTMQQASQRLKDADESVRKAVFEAMGKRRLQDEEALNELFNKLIEKRHQIAVNAGFENFRDYKLKSLNRFDYTKEDCFEFHASIQKYIVPLVGKIQQKQADLLGVTKIKPWNLEIDPTGKPPLKPFEGGEELLQKTTQIFTQIDPYFGDCLQTMHEMGHLDLDSKQGKAPGGYNYPLYEIGVPFIFMNAVGALRDLVTMVHEGGHAVHSFLSRDLKLTAFKNLPSEVAELASMSMELLTMDKWDVFFTDADELKRAKVEQLETILKILPWIAQIDAFQHWIYENHRHTTEEREQKWAQLSTDFGTGLVDWNGFEAFKRNAWHRQLHLFEVPFYYIEYGIAQLGALAVWKNSKTGFRKSIEDYKAALRLGYSRDIPEIYQTANISFDFSGDYIQELAQFVENELESIQNK